MSKELRELHDAVTNYALAHSVEEIPQLYYDKVVKIWQDMNLNGQDWDHSKAAATLLYEAVINGLIHRSQITPLGYKALNWAEGFQQKLKTVAT